MDEYTVFCTEEQARKALRLGAPIVSFKNALTRDDVPHFKIGDNKEWTLYFIPTTDQMIGWLEEQISFIDIIRQENNTWLYVVYFKNHSNRNITVKGFSSRKEATLAAIGAALEYLEKLKQ